MIEVENAPGDNCDTAAKGRECLKRGMSTVSDTLEKGKDEVIGFSPGNCFSF